MFRKSDFCDEVYQAIHDCLDMPAVIDTVTSMGYRVSRGMKPHDKEYGLGHVSIVHPDHDWRDNPLWISGYKVLNKKVSWIVR